MSGRRYAPQDLEGEEPPQISPTFGRDLFLEWREPRFGTSNPTDLTNPVWEWLIKTRKDAYQANEGFNGPPSKEKGPVWCFRRFGQSTTTLTDGRKIYIAGEHEDHYDPDFYIYNDVVVENSDGTHLIFGYPKDSFPPTDFHTATQVGTHIIIIGSLGYRSERHLNESQILRLSLKTFEIEKMATTGNGPGWIHEHTAELSSDCQKIIISGGLIQREDRNYFWENIDEWELDLSTWSWNRLTDKQWQRWAFVKKDKTPSHLYRIRAAINIRDYCGKDQFANELQKITSELGREPNLDLLPQLYRVDDSVKEIPPDEFLTNTFRISIDDLTVRFKEGYSGISAMVEGKLAPSRLKALQDSICIKLNQIHGGEWIVGEP